MRKFSSRAPFFPSQVREATASQIFLRKTARLRATHRTSLSLSRDTEEIKRRENSARTSSTASQPIASAVFIQPCNFRANQSFSCGKYPRKIHFSMQKHRTCRNRTHDGKDLQSSQKVLYNQLSVKWILPKVPRGMEPLSKSESNRINTGALNQSPLQHQLFLSKQCLIFPKPVQKNQEIKFHWLSPKGPEP